MKHDSKGLSLIEIGGDSCAGCMAVMPNCRNVAQLNGLEFISLNVEDDGEEVSSFAVDRIPAIILADGGKPFAQCTGYQPQEILEIWVAAKLDEYLTLREEK